MLYYSTNEREKKYMNNIIFNNGTNQIYTSRTQLLFSQKNTGPPKISSVTKMHLKGTFLNHLSEAITMSMNKIFGTKLKKK